MGIIVGLIAALIIAGLIFNWHLKAVLPLATYGPLTLVYLYYFHYRYVKKAKKRSKNIL